MNHAVALRSSSSMGLRKLTAAALFALGGAILLPSCGSDSPPIPKVTGTFSGSTLDARNYCALAGACQLFPDFGFAECMNQIARSEIELAPFGGDLGETARYECVKQAGSDCAAAKKCLGRVTTSDKRCTDPSIGEPFGNQPRSVCGANNRITSATRPGRAPSRSAAPTTSPSSTSAARSACRTPRRPRSAATSPAAIPARPTGARPTPANLPCTPRARATR